MQRFDGKYYEAPKLQFIQSEDFYIPTACEICFDSLDIVSITIDFFSRKLDRVGEKCAAEFLLIIKPISSQLGKLVSCSKIDTINYR